MATISQHQAAELWEVCRDHHTLAAKLEWFSTQVSDGQLRSTLERHARRSHQVCQQLEGFLQSGSATFTGSTGTFAQTHGQNNFGSGGYHQSGSFQSGSFQSGSFGYQGSQSAFGTGSSIDIMVAMDCLKDCKYLALQATNGASESSQPVRGFLNQLTGEHLQAAEEMYHWLEQRGMYASPKADQQTVQEYARALGQIDQTLTSRFGSGQYQQSSQFAQSTAGTSQFAHAGQYQGGQYQTGQYQTGQYQSFQGSQSMPGTYNRQQ